MEKPFVWPENLKYLKEPSLRFGDITTYDKITYSEKLLSDDDIETLTGIGIQMAADHFLIHELLDYFPMDQYEQSAKIYFLGFFLQGIDLLPNPPKRTLDMAMSILRRKAKLNQSGPQASILKEIGQDFGPAAIEELPEIYEMVQETRWDIVKIFGWYAIARISGKANEAIDRVDLILDELRSRPKPESAALAEELDFLIEDAEEVKEAILTNSDRV